MHVILFKGARDAIKLRATIYMCQHEARLLVMLVQGVIDARQQQRVLVASYPGSFKGMSRSTERYDQGCDGG